MEKQEDNIFWEGITLSLKGKKMESIRLDELALVLLSYQQILDRAYLAYQGRKRAGNFQREGFHASVKSWTKGSIIMELLIESYGLSQTAVMPNGISYLMDQVVEFYRARNVLWGKQEPDKGPTIEISGDHNNPVIVKGNENIIIISPLTQLGADMMEVPFKKLVDLIGKSAIDSLESCPSSVNESAKGFVLTKSDIGMLDYASDIGEAESMIVNVFQFNKKRGKGKLEVIESSTISRGEQITFYTSDDVSYDAIAAAMRKTVRRTPIVATREFHCHPSGERKISFLTIEKIG